MEHFGQVHRSKKLFLKKREGNFWNIKNVLVIANYLKFNQEVLNYDKNTKDETYIIFRILHQI